MEGAGMKEGLEELLVEELRDLYDAEKQLVRSLPRMAKASSSPELQDAFRTHLEETKGQVQRLEQIFELLGQKARSKPCKGMKGLVEEGQETMQEDLEEHLLDAAIIGSAQKIEHYEIAGYGTARALANTLGRKDAAQLLQETLDEEGATDKKLTAISKTLLKEAVRSASFERKDIEEEDSSRSRRGGGNGSRAKSARAGQTQTARTRGRSSTAAKSNRSRTTSGTNRSGRQNGGSAKSHITTDHDEIRQWAEERGAKPACVKGTGEKGDTGMIRIDFPGYSGGESLQPISWDEFFKKFDENNLALLYQEKTASGQKSNFNKLVKR
jgi:ferritin-like metal-binding protein YciE